MLGSPRAGTDGLGFVGFAVLAWGLRRGRQPCSQLESQAALRAEVLERLVLLFSWIQLHCRKVCIGRKGVDTQKMCHFGVIRCYTVYFHLPGLASCSCSSPGGQTCPGLMPPSRMRCCVPGLCRYLSTCLQFWEIRQHCSFLALGKPFPCHTATRDVSFQQRASPCSWSSSACLYGK